MKKDMPAVRILLVDDNVRGLSARRMILGDHGYDVETARSGEEAWEIFQSNHFDIVVTDLRMSGIDGMELIRRIRASQLPARVILLSGFASCLGLTVKSTGADEVITKGNQEVPELLRTVERLSLRPRKRRAASETGSSVRRSAQRAS
jgi:CheY-like chemotaxis protein